MSERDGGYAFPQTLTERTGFVGCEGMTLRDYFAAQALIACMSNDRWVKGLDDRTAEHKLAFSETLAETVYRYADAMLNERER